MIRTVLVILLAMAPSAPAVFAAPAVQRVITDESPIDERSVEPAWPDGAGRTSRPEESSTGRFELVLGVLFFVALAIYALLRYQARNARR